MIPALVAAALLHSSQPVAARMPFAVGETLEYGGKYSLAPFLGNVGEGTLSVLGVDTVHGVPAWHFRLSTDVHALGIYRNVTLLESWTAVSPFESLRFVHKVNENGHQYSDDDFQIWPDSGFFRNHNDSVTHPTPHDPLDDLAFLYFIRTMDFKAGAVYHIARYFHADHNPVTLTVIDREFVDMPDGSRRRCWVVHPLADDPKGLFSAKADTRVWISDDGVRLPVQLKFSAHPGTVTLQLRKISRGP